MTYDLHGQWDAGNQWASPGCPLGNCLRSHVNLTETTQSLAMITKAGVPASKVLLGQALYGRTVRMTDPACHGPDCTFRGGPNLGQATPGRCTQTRGYLANFEIREILATNPSARLYRDSQGDVLVYNDTQWASFLTPESYASRVGWAGQLNLGGTVDWAVDLDDDYGEHTVDPPTPAPSSSSIPVPQPAPTASATVADGTPSPGTTIDDGDGE